MKGVIQVFLNATVEDNFMLCNPSSLKKMCHCGTHSFMGRSSESNPVLKVYQGSAGLCLTTLLLSAKAQILILLKTNLAKYLCLSLPLEHENYK